MVETRNLGVVPFRLLTRKRAGMSLELIDVVKSYREPEGTTLPILNIPHFTVGPQEQVALVGSSGGGKSTLLNLIAGITTADAGQILIGGIDVSKLVEPARDRFRAERIGYIFQTFNLLPAFTAYENVLLGMSFSRGKADPARAKQLLERIGLGRRLSHKPGQLSVGEQQRVAIARALANKPQLLLADEPTASVDPTNQEAILELIGELCREQQTALLLVTHDPQVAQRFDRIARLAEFNQVLQPS